jgi:nicotinamide-nucleotide amidase
MENFNIPGDMQIQSLVRELAAALCARGWQMATAESCTGGWIAKCCTDIAGSSSWFERGFVTYSDSSKADLLDVAADSIAACGAVSADVAAQMAEGARRNAGVQAAVSVTGIAGPDGGSEEKPVGTVWFGWSLENGPLETSHKQFAGDRDAIRRQTVAHALAGLLQLLAQSADTTPA